MLNEKRVIQMTRMEMRRNREYDDVESFINLEKKDFMAFSNVLGFVVGTVFYVAVVVAVGAALFTLVLANLTKFGGIIFLLVAAIGYVAFIFFYRSWYYHHSLDRYKEARATINSMRRDWTALENIYRQEEEAAKPTVDMNLLFPEGSFGENE